MTAITASEILTKYSTTAGAAGNANTGTAAGSLGKYVSTTQWAGGSANDLFDDVSGTENAGNTVDYRCIFVHNSNASNPLETAYVYLSAEVGGGAAIAVGADTTAASALGSATAQALTIANETTAPSGVTFSSPITQGAAVSLGTIPAGQVKAFWIRRTASNSAAQSNDGVTFTVGGDTGSL